MDVDGVCERAATGRSIRMVFSRLREVPVRGRVPAIRLRRTQQYTGERDQDKKEEKRRIKISTSHAGRQDEDQESMRFRWQWLELLCFALLADERKKVRVEVERGGDSRPQAITGHHWACPPLSFVIIGGSWHLSCP
jgi:hypothetical protein